MKIEPYVWLAAVACGFLVATLYIAQPLIDTISADIGLSRDSAGTAVAGFQMSYAVGLILLLPLADKLENRRLVVLSCTMTAVALAGIAFSTSVASFIALAFIAGASCVGAQILIPMLVGLTQFEKRGRTIGIVMSGLLLGVLFARPAASFLSSGIGWRGVFLSAAGILLLIATLLHIFLPTSIPQNQLTYLDSLKSLGTVFSKYTRLRRRMFYQASLFGVFSGYWTTIPLLLIDKLNFDQNSIGAFTFAAAGGALVAPFAGRIADAGHARVGTILALSTAIISLAVTQPFLLISSVLGLVVASLLIDAAVQMNHILSQSVIFRLSDTERARINALYMFSLFASGATASFVGPLIYQSIGWAGFVLVGTAALIPATLIETRLSQI